MKKRGRGAVRKAHKSPVRKIGGKGGLKRLFFAVDLPEATMASAERLMETFAIPPGTVRWARPGNMHITIKFLGETEEEKIPAIREAASSALSSFAPARLTIEGMGIFPNHDKPRVVWFGVGGDTAALSVMEAELSKSLEGLGFLPDQRPFTAHLTIGRVKSDLARGPLIRLVRAHQKEFIGDAPLNEIVLYESSLNPAGAIYTVVERFPLQGEK